MFLLFLLRLFWLPLIAAIQFWAVSRARPAVYRPLTVIAVAILPIATWFALTRPSRTAAPAMIPPAIFGRDLAMGALVVALAGIAGWTGWDGVTRWFRGIAILFACLAALIAVGLLGLFVMLSKAHFH